MGTGQVAGSALLTGWVRVDRGPARGHCWAGNCSFPFQKAHLPFCVCVCVCEGVSVCLSLVICTAPWDRAEASEVCMKGAAPPMPPDSIPRGWSPPRSSWESRSRAGLCVCLTARRAASRPRPRPRGQERSLITKQH